MNGLDNRVGSAEGGNERPVAMKRIQDLFSTTNYQKCLHACQSILQDRSENVFAWKYAGKSLLALGQFEKAQQCLSKAHKLDSTDPEILKDIGNIFNALNNDTEATKLYERSLSIDPDYAPAINNLGLIAKQQGNLAKAEKLIKRACDLDQLFAPYHTNMGTVYKDLGKLDKALSSTLKSLELKPNNPDVLMNLGGIYKDLGKLDKALSSTLKSLELKPNNPDALMNLGGIYKDLGKLDKALSSTLHSLELKPIKPEALMNLGIIYKELGNLDNALAYTLKSLELKSNNPEAHMNLGAIYKELGNLDNAIISTLKSLEFKPENHTAYINLGAIYKELGNLDNALAYTLKSLELKPDNPKALKNISSFIEQTSLNFSNANNITRAYELILKQTNISHRKISKIFLQAFLPTIQKASKSNPLISESNDALKKLANDWRFRKSLSLMIPPSAEAEEFFTRLRKELLTVAIQKDTFTPQLKFLAEALAAQCYLNEYVYCTSKKEEDAVAQIIETSKNSQEAVNNYLAILGCYKSIHTTTISPDLINNYPTHDDISLELITSQFKEPCQERELKRLIQDTDDTTNKISQRVQEMYEGNPYPRFKYSDFTVSELAEPVFKTIELETTKQNQTFPKELSSQSSRPKILIAGCGTGNQVINASRYKNAQITAIDLSSNSLAYAIRKSKEYEMKNVKFKKMDILNVPKLRESFDVVICSGVLHHMEQPTEGLSALLQQLKVGGYIKLGLYSDLARKVIVNARKTIQSLGVTSNPEGIRNFRRKVINGEIQELLDLPKFGSDFFSMSECRDLCFHVQEHRFTIEKLQKLLDLNGLTFSGFILPEQIKKYYQELYPEDSNMTTLKNWADFEKKHPSTFEGMYQFWSQKIH